MVSMDAGVWSSAMVPEKKKYACDAALLVVVVAKGLPRRDQGGTLSALRFLETGELAKTLAVPCRAGSGLAGEGPFAQQVPCSCCIANSLMTGFES